MTENLDTWDASRPLKDAPFFMDFVRALPKVELHQHLTGSLNNESLKRALERKGLPESEHICPLSEAFKDDAWGHLTRYCIACAKAVAPEGGSASFEEEAKRQQQLFEEAFDLLRSAGVMYAELRVGLKHEPTKRAYLERLLEAVERENVSGRGLRLGILVSVARHGELAYGEESAEVAEEFWKQGRPVCGIELGGVPAKSDFATEWRPVFEKARAAGMRVALHCGEDAGKQRILPV